MAGTHGKGKGILCVCVCFKKQNLTGKEMVVLWLFSLKMKLHNNVTFLCPGHPQDQAPL